MKTYIASLLAVCFSVCTFAQDSKGSKPVQFRSATYLGLLNGQTGQNILVQTTNGIRKGNWSAGIGVGIDYYAERSVPVYIEINRALSSKLSSPFVYLNGGLNIPWLESTKKANAGYIKTRTGSYFDLGAGYKVSLGNEQFFVFSVGYNQKVTKAVRERFMWIAPWTPLDNTEDIVNRFNRIVLKIGFQFN